MATENDFRNMLIQQTVSEAVKTRCYAELYDGIETAGVCDVSDLSILPVITKDRLRSFEYEFASSCASVAYVQNTSGSTGEPLFIYRSAEEANFIWKFFAECISDKVPEVKPLQLNFAIPQHGNPTPVPGHVFVLSSSTTDEKLIEHALMLLRKKFSIPGFSERVSVLAGSHLPVLLLTNYILEHQFDRSEFAVKLIAMTGRYLTKRWRDTLKRVWDAVVIDRYSLSEVFGAASSCPACEAYHFDLHVVPELIDINTKQPLSEGFGVLLLTSLHPFVQTQPVIRYWTGDLFELKLDICHSPSYFLRGRLVHALFNPKTNKMLLSGSDLIEATDDIPSVNRTAHFRDVTTLKYTKAVGMPYIRGRVKETENNLMVDLDVEVVFTPGLFVSHEDWIKSTITARLKDSSPQFKAALDRQEITFNINLIPQGQLGSLEKKTQLWNEQ